VLEREYQYFETHFEELKGKYIHQFVIIVGEQVKGAFSSQKEALAEALKTNQLGTFLVQEVPENKPDIIHRFTSRVFV
jgi:hypothetical protein